MYVNHASLSEKHLPSSWKVTAIPKKRVVEGINKDPRPISLTPTVSKITKDCVVREQKSRRFLVIYDKTSTPCIHDSSTTHTFITLLHSWSKATDNFSADVRVVFSGLQEGFRHDRS